MATWTPFSDWMLFKHLDINEGLTNSFTLAHKITNDDTGETWSRRFDRFKAKEVGAIAPAAVLLGTALPELMQALILNASEVVILPALSSGEITAGVKNTMRALGSKLSEKTGAQFDPNALSKKAHDPIHGIYNAPGRKAEREKAEYSCGPLKAKTVIVLDDFITEGGTLSKIAQAIHASNAGTTVYGVALAKTERRRWDPNISNDHVPKKWNDLWIEGERKYADLQKAKAK